MSKMLKIAGGVLGLCVVLGVVVWFAFLNGPTAEAVCDKVFSLTKTEIEKVAGAEAATINTDELLGQSVDECVKDENQDADIRGIIKTKEVRECIIKAESLEAAADCDK
ncbi:MAG: hypothetical protein OHK0017_13370 [Patescibacteria group bacterium]